MRHNQRTPIPERAIRVTWQDTAWLPRILVGAEAPPMRNHRQVLECGQSSAALAYDGRHAPRPTKSADRNAVRLRALRFWPLSVFGPLNFPANQPGPTHPNQPSFDPKATPPRFNSMP